MKKSMLTIFAMAAMAVVAEVYPYGVCSHVTRWEGSEYNLSRNISRMKMAGIRYYAWDNRAPGKLKVWLDYAE